MAGSRPTGKALKMPGLLPSPPVAPDPGHSTLRDASKASDAVLQGTCVLREGRCATCSDGELDPFLEGDGGVDMKDGAECDA